VGKIIGIHASTGANTRAGPDAADCDARRSQTGARQLRKINNGKSKAKSRKATYLAP
jgi:hypothetical protein